MKNLFSKYVNAEYYRTKRHSLRDWLLSLLCFLAKLINWIPYQLQLIGMKNPITHWLLDKIGIDLLASIPFLHLHIFQNYTADKKRRIIT